MLAHWAWQQLKKLTLDFTSLGAHLNSSLNFHLGKETHTNTHTHNRRRTREYWESDSAQPGGWGWRFKSFRARSFWLFLTTWRFRLAYAPGPTLSRDSPAATEVEADMEHTVLSTTNSPSPFCAAPAHACDMQPDSRSSLSCSPQTTPSTPPSSPLASPSPLAVLF